MTEIKKNRWLLVLAISLWIAGIGLAAPWEEPSLSSMMGTAVTAGQQTAPPGVWDALKLFGMILGNNVGVALFMIVGGLLSGGVLAAGGLLWNGFILGMIIRQALVAGLSVHALAVRLVFHGPIEILALSLAGALGMRGAKLAVAWTRTGNIPADLLPSAEALKLVAILLSGAAFLEVSVMYTLRTLL